MSYGCLRKRKIQEPRNSCAVTEKMNEREMRVEEEVDRMELNPVSRKHTKKYTRILPSCRSHLDLLKAKRDKRNVTEDMALSSALIA